MRVCQSRRYSGGDRMAAHGYCPALKLAGSRPSGSGDELQMTPPSRPVQRVISVLDFFAEHSRQAFTLAQIIKALDISRATGHAIVMALVEGGYLYRNPDKTFVVGPKLVGIGRNSRSDLIPMDIARHEMRVIADDYGVVVAAIFSDQGQLVVRERAVSRRHLSRQPLSDTFYALQPATHALLSVSSPVALEAFLAQHYPTLGADQRGALETQVTFLARHGFLVVQGGPPGSNFSMGELAGSEVVLGTVLSEIDDGHEYAVRVVASQAINGRDDVQFVLAAYGFMEELAGSTVKAIGHRLKVACDRVAAFSQ
ncbi:MAG: hypothetical protein EOP84_09460 [Verrucomicrobiaceae bacterium]|nr:MAG: hypothetical protein EOP84_09460 [Verrucomicrobiaceae bacterium]